MIESARLLEHVFPKHAVVKAGRDDRAHVMEAARLDRLGEGERVGDAGDVGVHHLLRRRSEVVDRREMEEMIDPALELAGVARRDAEIGLGYVASDQGHTLGAAAPELLEAGDELGRQLRRIDQHVDGLLVALEQPPDKPPADKPRSPRHERAHEQFLSVVFPFSGF